MEPVPVRANIFKIKPAEANQRSLESLLGVIDTHDLEDRIRNASGAGIRLDFVEKQTTTSSDSPRDFWLLDFTRLRVTHGPGRTSRNEQVSGFDLNDDEFFGEEAAALYLPQTNHIIVQYNHYGVRPSHIQSYLGEYLGNEANAFEFEVMLDDDAEAIFNAQTLIRRFEIGVDLSKLTAQQRARGDSLSDAAANAAAMHGARMRISISVGQSRHGYLSGAKELLRKFLDGNEAVTTAIVSGRETAESETEVVDLIHHKLTHVDDITPGPDRRLPREDRFGLLLGALTKWQRRIDG